LSYDKLLIAPEGIEIMKFLYVFLKALFRLLIAPEGIEITMHFYL